ncbi:hypothetical protein CDD80_2495 [Ophiocordyceps camponoti-rufipedis]|uniref:Uncharacterized protein n=1 Tax=Ophiocordyceps camponoti-rufipedis TaxID=2004952 RepID=A0A2C5YB21_9HYPO|nr:hypothetical protein CDD80_2495 [Ophiocordyceps camponoti-rufipedis]
MTISTKQSPRPSDDYLQLAEKAQPPPSYQAEPPSPCSAQRDQLRQIAILLQGLSNTAGDMRLFTISNCDLGLVRTPIQDCPVYFSIVESAVAGARRAIREATCVYTSDGVSAAATKLGNHADQLRFISNSRNLGSVRSGAALAVAEALAVVVAAIQALLRFDLMPFDPHLQPGPFATVVAREVEKGLALAIETLELSDDMMGLGEEMGSGSRKAAAAATAAEKAVQITLKLRTMEPGFHDDQSIVHHHQVFKSGCGSERQRAAQPQEPPQPGAAQPLRQVRFCQHPDYYHCFYMDNEPPSPETSPPEQQATPMQRTMQQATPSFPAALQA